MPQQAKADCCCCCDDEGPGIWWSRGPGRTALIIGGAVLVGAAGGAIAGYTASNHNSSSSSSDSSTNQRRRRNQRQEIALPGGNAGFPNLTVPTGNGEGVNNTLTGLVSGDQLPNGGAITPAGGTGTDPNTGATTTSIAALTQGKKQSPIRREKKQTQLTIHFTPTISGEAQQVFVKPFVTCPDGTMLEGTLANVTARQGNQMLSPIIVENPMEGSYRLGMHYTVCQPKGAVTITLENNVIHSQNGAIAGVNTFAGTCQGDGQMMNEFHLKL